MNTTVRVWDPVTSTLLLGASTVIAQALLLREGMAATGGSEVAWGLVMALWLGGVALGSRLGVRLGSPDVGSALPVVALVLGGAGVVLFRAAPAILAVAPGETITTWHAVWLWALAVVPAAGAGGLAFPALAGELGRGGAGRAYTVEAAGALLGGTILTVALVPLGTGAALLLAIGLVGGATLWRRRHSLAVVLGVACVAAAVPAGEMLARGTWRWTGHPGELGHWAETRHQRLEASIGPPTNLYADGRLVASYPDPYTTFSRAHLMMLLHPAPRRVLALGCAADGSAEAMARHPVTELILVDEDPRLVPVLGEWYGEDFGALLSSPKVTARAGDPLRTVIAAGDLDLVILADGDPINLRANRTRTVEFLGSCRRAMRDDGILVMRVGVGDSYLGGIAGDLLATLTSTLREVFPRVAAVPGESVLLVAGTTDARLDISVASLLERRLDRPEIGGQLHPALLPVLLDERRQADLEGFVTEARRPPNTLQRPRAVPIAARLHESRSLPVRSAVFTAVVRRLPVILSATMAVAVIGLIGLAISGGTVARAMATASVVGFTSMGWWLLLLATWQATRGSVYAEVGALTGLFMAGVAGGGWASHRSGRQVRVMPWLIVAGVGLSLVLAAGAPVRSPVLVVPVLLILGGVLTGAAFPGLGELAGRGAQRRGAGLALAADEAGAAAAALIIGTAAVPWIGMSGTAAALAALGLAAVPVISRASAAS